MLGARSSEPVPRPARRPPPVVPLPPPLRRRAAGAPGGEQPTGSPDLHRRAGAWYGQGGDRSDAIRHAMAGEDFDRAADEANWRSRRCARVGGGATIRRWLEALPHSLIRPGPCSAFTTPGRSCSSASSRASKRACGMPNGGWTPGPGDGRDPNAQSTPLVVVDEEEFRRLPGAIAILPCRPGPRSRRRGQHREIRPTRARPRTRGRPPDARFGSGAPGTRGLDDGDYLEEAHRLYTDCTASLEKAGYISDIIGCAISLADIRIAQGRLREAMTTYERGLQRATQPGAPLLRGAAGHATWEWAESPSNGMTSMPPGSTC